MVERLTSTFSFELDVTVRTTVNPSEDPAIVLAAIDLLFGTSSRTGLTASGGSVEAVYSGSQALEKVYEQVRSKGTVNVLRRLLRHRKEEWGTSFLINKQMATRGVVVLCENEAESPLGAISVGTATPEVGHFIDWIAPSYERHKRSFRKR